MKRVYIFAVFLSLLTFTDVYACGEIKKLESNIGCVSVVDDTTFLVTIPEGTKEVSLTGSTDYKWIEGFAPRQVSTSEVAQLQVDGSACGFGIYTYFVKFKTLSNLIAENDTPPSDEQNPVTPEQPDPNTQTPNVSDNSTDGKLILKSLTIEDHEIEFDPYTYEYSLEVGLDVKSLNIQAETEEGVVVSISGNANDLKDGENNIALTLLDIRGNTNVYNIKVNRVAAKSDNNFLSNLQVIGYQLNFDPSTFIYELGIRKEKTLSLSIVTQDEAASYTILGNANLKNGSEVTIVVTAENGDTRNYVIKVERVFNIMDYWVYIALVVLIIILVILLLINKKQKNKKNLGPQTIEGQSQTAGVVQDIAPQNVNSENASLQSSENNSNSTQVEVGTLKIIEPTNIEASPQEELSDTSGVDEDNSPTEIFQL